MLTNTFCHLPGVGLARERKLWSAGITTWNSLLSHTALGSLPGFKPAWLSHLKDSQDHLAVHDCAFFADGLPSNCHWRLFPDFRHSCAFLDIETTGFLPYAEITTIALFDGQTVRHYVSGDNLDRFPQDIQAYRLLVTFNGKLFDIPFIEQQFGIRLPHAHVDLRFVLKSLGISGGLKRCERQLGIVRSGLEDVDGFLAVLLWNDYRRRGNRKALETLLAYNIQDAINLQTLMIHAFNAKVQHTPFADAHCLPARLLPELPFKPDRATIERLVRHSGSASRW